MTRHLRLPRWFTVTFLTGARRALADWPALVMAAGVYMVILLVVSTLWRAAAAETDGGLIAGYSAAALTWYLATSELAYTSVSAKMIEEIGDQIVAGDVASEMLRPAPVLGVRVATQLGRTLPRFVLSLPAGVVLSLVLVGRPPDLAAALLAIPAAALAITCNLLAMHAVAGASFWIRDARSSWFLYQKLMFVFGGMLIPLEVLPQGMHDAALALPFLAMSYAPARLASGHFEPHLLLVQLAWTAVVVVAATTVFARGERHVQVAGG